MRQQASARKRRIRALLGLVPILAGIAAVIFDANPSASSGEDGRRGFLFSPKKTAAAPAPPPASDPALRPASAATPAHAAPHAHAGMPANPDREAGWLPKLAPGRFFQGDDPFPMPPELVGVKLNEQSDASIAAKSAGCVACHQNTGDPHSKKGTVRLGCTDCHGGNGSVFTKEEAHIFPQVPAGWNNNSGNPIRSYTLLNHESPDFVRFVNPGDLRVAHISCGTSGCHGQTVEDIRKSMMTHGGMLWGAALYNNGAVMHKRARYGESYSMHGIPQRLVTVPAPTEEETRDKGILPYLDPLPKFEMTQPGNILRIFERGGRFSAQEIGLPEVDEEPGRPRARLSTRGLGTLVRTDPVFIGLAKTRLFDPTLNFMGTNDHPGDYRSSGCTSCHVVYANDRSPVNSGPFHIYGNRGTSFSPDPMIPKNEPGHPIAHRFVYAPPTSQCIVCHIHPGTTVMNSYTGFMWWNMENDGKKMFPPFERKVSPEEWVKMQMSDPHEASVRGNWADPEFLARVADLNPELEHTQFADYHGHGWNFSAVFKKDRKGHLLDVNGKVIEHVDSQKLNAAMVPPTPQEQKEGKCGREDVPVHLMDIHLEKGMHCADCHFNVSAHGNGKLYGEVRNAIEIQCIDCHGTAARYANLLSSGPASPPGGVDLASLRSPSGKKRFEWIKGKLYQRSTVDPKMEWEVVQTKDTVTPGKDHYNQKSHMAKTVRFGADGVIEWGDVPKAENSAYPYDDDRCAHSYREMSCIACHSSWNPSCFGCHLPQRANMKMPELHSKGDVSRNYVSYNWQTLRDDVFMLARDGHVTGSRVNPARSSCAIHVGSYNNNRESVYVQQQTISAEGMSGIAFSVNVPHTVRGGPPKGKDGRALHPENYLSGRNETKQCSDCHVSMKNDNNAIMAQLLMQGTNFTNFIGKWAWVAGGEEGLAAIAVTERDEPQTVIGSHMHKVVYPERYAKHVEDHKELHVIHEHPGKDIGEGLFKKKLKPEIHALQARGEFLYVAAGEAGLRVFDIAFIDHKGFSERIVTAPVSPFGQKLYVRMPDCRDVVAPTTIAPDPTRTHKPENMEQSVSLVYAFIYCADAEEGLVMVNAATLLDGDPANNFFKKDVVYNPQGLLTGAKKVTVIGNYVYLCCDRGLAVISLEDPTKPKLVTILGREHGICDPRSVQPQFRYAFVADAQGVKVLDIQDLANPRVLPHATFPMEEIHNLYVARTYAYLAAGSKGLVILNVENPEQPKLDQIYNAEGEINDLRDVKLGITYNSEFAYLADGANGLAVVQLTSTETPGHDGFSPRPTPELIAHHKLPNEGVAMAIAEGIDRDRAVDESGNQIAVFGRVGARPLSLEEQRKMYMKNGRTWKVVDDPASPIYRYVGPKVPQDAKKEPLKVRTNREGHGLAPSPALGPDGAPAIPPPPTIPNPGGLPPLPPLPPDH